MDGARFVDAAALLQLDILAKVPQFIRGEATNDAHKAKVEEEHDFLNRPKRQLKLRAKLDGQESGRDDPHQVHDRLAGEHGCLDQVLRQDPRTVADDDRVRAPRVVHECLIKEYFF